jgi:hypothetical protein
VAGFEEVGEPKRASAELIEDAPVDMGADWFHQVER